MIRFNQRKLFGIDLDLEKFKVDKKIEEVIKNELLIISALDGIYTYDGKKVKKISEISPIFSLEYCDGKVFGGGPHGIYDILKDELISKRYKTKILTCCNGKLYNVSVEGIGIEGIYETFSEREIRRRVGRIFALVCCNGKLYDVYESSSKISSIIKISETFNDELIRERYQRPYSQNPINIVCYKGELYDSIEDGRIYRTSKNTVVADRKSEVWSLAICNDNLYDADSSGIYNTFNNKLIVKTKFAPRYIRCIDEKLYYGGSYGVYEVKLDNQENVIYHKRIFEKGVYDLLVVKHEM